MSADVIALVLLGALLHAGWNAVVKAGQDKALDMAAVAGGGGLIAALLLPFLPVPAAGSWPFLAASVAIHVVYFLLVAAAYRSADMSYAYPLMRGSAPLLVAAASGIVIGERLTATAWAGVLLISGGVIALALVYRRSRPAAMLRPTLFSLSNAAVIAAYTLVDGLGARLSAAPVAYTLWLFLLSAVGLVGWTLWRQPGRLAAAARRRWLAGLGGGACSAASYGLALWAMTLAPIAPVAALRETSILFGVLLAALFLKEPLTAGRPIAVGVVALGAIVLRLA